MEDSAGPRAVAETDIACVQWASQYPLPWVTFWLGASVLSQMVTEGALGPVPGWPPGWYVTGAKTGTSASPSEQGLYSFSGFSLLVPCGNWSKEVQLPGPCPHLTRLFGFLCFSLGCHGNLGSPCPGLTGPLSTHLFFLTLGWKASVCCVLPLNLGSKND